MRSRAAFTLIELAVALAVAGLIGATALPAAAAARDRLAVRAAHRELATAVAWTRSGARVAGGAVLVVDVPAGRAWIELPGGTDPRTFELASRHGVSLHTARGVPVRLRYDGLGIGRLATTTVQIRRGRAATSFVVSAYGRVRP